MKLSIAVVTMNRAAQLQEALESCLKCELPNDTEFVIIDNASTDNTETVVFETLHNTGYSYYYEKLPENLGCGGGRNYAYLHSKGEYMYMLDDDATIDCFNNPHFFIEAIDTLDKNPTIYTLTTQIYDNLWKRNRLRNFKNQLGENLYKILMFCGGSHFLSRRFFGETEPYLANKYGYEEIPPSLLVCDAGGINAFRSDLLVFHNPINNKWDWADEKNQELLIKAYVQPYVIKWLMYPLIFRPILWLGYTVRSFKLLCTSKIASKLCTNMIRDLKSTLRLNKKIKFSTVFKMLREFGLSVF